MGATFFISQDEFHRWLEANHHQTQEIIIGFYKTKSSHKGITYPQALDEALAYGWIDGVRKSIDDDSYQIRWTPRKPGSIWSAVNIKRVAELTALGLMQPSGLKTFEARKPEKSGLYSHENRPQTFDAAQENIFRENPAAWEFFQAQAPSYQRTSIWWVVSAKQEKTRLKRLAELIDYSAKGRRMTDVWVKGKKNEADGTG